MNETYKAYSDLHYDTELAGLPHYQHYPEMLPFVGSHYRKMNKRVLVIGESHYLKEGKQAHLDEKLWYDGTAAALLDSEDKSWIHTRGTSGSGIDQRYGSKAYGIYRQVEYAIRDLLRGEELPTDNYFRYAAYYNYFQRPAKTGVSLTLTGQDREVAYNHLIDFVNVIEPTHLAFVSKLAYSAFWKIEDEKSQFREVEIFGTPHPGCSWWNRVHWNNHLGVRERHTGKDWFKKRVGEMWVE